MGYAGGDGDHAAAALRAALTEVEGEPPLTLTRASESVYRRSALLRHRAMPAVEDVVVYASRAPPLHEATHEAIHEASHEASLARGVDKRIDESSSSQGDECLRKDAWLAQLNGRLEAHGAEVCTTARRPFWFLLIPSGSF